MEVDPVGHLEALGLADLLDVPDHLAGQPPPTEVVVDGQIEGDHLGPVAGDGEPRLGPHPQFDLVPAELDEPVSKLDGDRAPGGQVGRRRRAVDRAHG